MSWFFVFFIISTERFNKKLDNRRRLVYTNFWVMGMILINKMKECLTGIPLLPVKREPCLKSMNNKKKEDDG